MHDTAQRIDFALPPEASLRKISGEMLNQPGFANFLFDLGSCFLNCNDLTKTISIRASAESKKSAERSRTFGKFVLLRPTKQLHKQTHKKRSVSGHDRGQI